MTFRNAAKIDNIGIIAHTFYSVNTVIRPVLTKQLVVMIRQIFGYHTLDNIEVFSKFRLVPNRAENICERFMTISRIMSSPGHSLIKIEIHQQLG
ncbi:hypothetical protein DSA75_19090 [Salmonella enterica subsp. enterica serovar Typhimurium]|nr:hypothetical protein [Salmonella enterica subsp. enterica serovar Typhimurium]